MGSSDRPGWGRCRFERSRSFLRALRPAGSEWGGGSGKWHSRVCRGHEGASLFSFGAIAPNSQVRDNNTWGALKLTLQPTSYDWEFIPVAGQTFADSGSASCVSPPSSNDPPVANDDNTSTPKDTPVSIDVAANDTDPDGNVDRASVNIACPTCAAPTNGSMLNNGDGTIDYTPNSGFTGSDSFVYEVCDTIGACDDEVSTEATSLTIQGEDVDNAATFTTVNGSVSSRPTTTAAVSWSPPSWITKDEAGPDQQTPNIASVVQEIVSRPGWASGNSLVIFITGTGKRTAESYNGVPIVAPLLHVEF